MNNEKFKLWKLALSTIHVDGKITSKELEWFDTKIEFLENNKILNFDEKQVNELRSVLQTPVKNFLEEFEELKKPADCSHLSHVLRVV